MNAPRPTFSPIDLSRRSFARPTPKSQSVVECVRLDAAVERADITLSLRTFNGRTQRHRV